MDLYDTYYFRIFEIHTFLRQILNTISELAAVKTKQP